MISCVPFRELLTKWRGTATAGYTKLSLLITAALLEYTVILLLIFLTPKKCVNFTTPNVSSTASNTGARNVVRTPTDPLIVVSWTLKKVRRSQAVVLAQFAPLGSTASYQESVIKLMVSWTHSVSCQKMLPEPELNGARSEITKGVSEKVMRTITHPKIIVRRKTRSRFYMATQQMYQYTSDTIASARSDGYQFGWIKRKARISWLFVWIERKSDHLSAHHP